MRIQTTWPYWRGAPPLQGPAAAGAVGEVSGTVVVDGAGGGAVGEVSGTVVVDGAGGGDVVGVVVRCWLLELQAASTSSAAVSGAHRIIPAS
jgi:hypothetical protein